MAYAIVGGFLAIVQLLSIVLACCYANQIAKEEDNSAYLEEQRWQDYEYERTASRPATPLTPRAKSDLRSNNETAF